jgi:hypothetical protein
MDRAYLPFMLLIIAAFANELTSEITGRVFKNTNVNANIYVLLESIFILWQFKRWKLFDRYRNFFHGLLGAFITVWLVECFLISKIIYIASYFRIFYSFAVALMSVQMINVLIVNESRSLAKNATFLICIGFIIFFTYKVLVEVFWLYGLNHSNDFRANVYRILLFINLFTNLIYALAALWIPRKQIFTMRF